MAVVGNLKPGKIATVKSRVPPLASQRIAECDLLAHLDELSNLPDNWDSYGAAAPNALALDAARSALELLIEAGIPVAHIGPSVENGVGISFRANGRESDMEFFNSGENVAVTYDSNGEPRVAAVANTRDELRAAIATIRDYLYA